MKLEFKEGILEYANGDYNRKNGGKPFEVDQRFGQELLATGYFRDADEVLAEKLSLEHLSRTELNSMADKLGLDPSEYKNKGEIIAAIQLAEEAAETEE